MQATLDKIKSFLKEPVSYVNMRNADSFRENYYSPSLGEALPMTDHYYHPLNPCFLFELSGPAIMQHSPVITVRDGYLSFMDFLLNNHQALAHWNTLFIIPRVFEKLIPRHLARYFIGYDFIQKEKSQGQHHKFIFAYLTEEYLGSDIDLTLSKVNLSPKQSVTLYLPQETNLEKVSYNNIFTQKFLFKLADKLRDHEINHINTHDFLNTSDFSGFEFVNLGRDYFQIYDNFIPFLMASRGCQSIYPRPSDRALLTIELSMFHQMALYQLNPQDFIFSELLMYRKQHPARKLMEDVHFSSLLRNFMDPTPHKA